MTLPATYARILQLLVPPAVVLSIHGVLSLGFDAYTRVPSLDIPLHLAGGVAIAYTFHSCLTLAENASLIQLAHPILRVLLVVCLVTSAATGWEFVEFTSDSLLATGAQKSLADTLLDMFLGILGGALFITALALRKSPLHR